ncbi:hypothetical protein DPMN_025799 [Dreissena polymorpha]|uniref:Uncharacterized protein n=1 Tax=Dreissena polymorpha TaxID=45954 RepID=A0A9D4LS12_DREPO|nr:hypothetical protein DPMN_025799 [Dreissena polymorpha]
MHSTQSDCFVTHLKYENQLGIPKCSVFTTNAISGLQDVPNLRFAIVENANSQDWTNFYVNPLSGLITLNKYLDTAGNNQQTYTVC